MNDLTIKLSGAVSIKRGDAPAEITAIEIETTGTGDEAPGSAADVGAALRESLEALTGEDECYG